MKEIDLNHILINLKKITYETGIFQLEHFRKNTIGPENEKGARDFVTQADIKSEEIIKSFLKKLMPKAGFWGEETDKKKGDKYTWVVDPIDGTTNYMSGLHQWSISIALLDNNQPIIGIIYSPYTEETFYCIKNKGVYHIQTIQGKGILKKLKKQKKYSLKNALIGTGFPYRSPDTAQSFFKCANQVLYASRGIRRFGSAALDLSYLAAGYLQGFFEVDLAPHDVAAAILFLEETGVITSDFHGNPYNMFESRTFVAAPPGVYKELMKICDKNYK